MGAVDDRIAGKHRGRCARRGDVAHGVTSGNTSTETPGEHSAMGASSPRVIPPAARR